MKIGGIDRRLTELGIVLLISHCLPILVLVLLSNLLLLIHVDLIVLILVAHLRAIIVKNSLLLVLLLHVWDVSALMNVAAFENLL